MPSPRPASEGITHAAKEGADFMYKINMDKLHAGRSAFSLYIKIGINGDINEYYIIYASVEDM